MAPASKSVFVSYAENDKSIALELHSALTGLLGEDVWIRDLDLNGGDIVIEALNDAVSAAKWFVILISETSVTSKYLRLEADYASFRALQDLGVRIIVIRLDAAPLPKHLEIALGSQDVVNIASSSDRQGDFIQIAEYIDKHVISAQPASVYVDRGEKSDEFALAARRNPIVFILGLAGIGKSSFVLNSISERLKKRPLTIKLTRGHSLDLLCRQIVQRAHTTQPAPDCSDEWLLDLAISAIQQRADRYFTFLDNAEEALDASGQLLPYLHSFLMAMMKSGAKTHVVLATTRNPDISVDVNAFSDVLRLDGFGQAIHQRGNRAPSAG
jgi:hypothetical protein